MERIFTIVYFSFTEILRLFYRVISVSPDDLIPRQNLEKQKWNEKQLEMGEYWPEKYGYITVDRNCYIMDGHHRYQRILERNKQEKIKVQQLRVTYQTFLTLVWLGLLIAILIIGLFITLLINFIR